MPYNVVHRQGIDRATAANRRPEESLQTPAGPECAFIVGHRKSGSTWLLNLLSLHPDVRGVMETHLFRHGWQETDPASRVDKLFEQTPWGAGGPRQWPVHQMKRLAKPFLLRVKPALRLAPDERPAELPDLGLLDQLALRRELRRIGTPEEFVQRFFEILLERLRPRRYLIEKSPRNVYFVERIRSLFPRAKLIVIYRDGRDVVVSDRFFTEDYGNRSFSFEQAVADWRRDMETHLRYAEGHTLCAVSYEALLTDGKPVVESLLRFLGLPYDDALVADLLERSSFRFHAGRERGQENRKRFYRKGIVGDWRNHFTPEHKRIFKDVAGDMLIRLGYEKDLDW
ncbi:MAG TPA: sulfotransferase [Thermoanaerobaculia bacterium]|nr:sulfotransferase [Thermoanaerobaculia bacterium]